MALPYARLRILGTLPGGEVWSVNPAFEGNFGEEAADQDALNTWSSNAVLALQSSLGTFLKRALSSSATLATVRAEVYGADGKLARRGETTLGSPIFGTSSARMPTTAAVALSLRTVSSTRRGRGRLYWPALGLSIDPATTRIPATDVAGLAQDAAAMLADLEDAAPAGLAANLVVWSNVNLAGLSVRSIDVGDVIDSQRRRKDALVEVRTSASYPPA